jgi:hypothetical protein
VGIIGFYYRELGAYVHMSFNFTITDFNFCQPSYGGAICRQLFKLNAVQKKNFVFWSGLGAVPYFVEVSKTMISLASFP